MSMNEMLGLGMLFSMIAGIFVGFPVAFTLLFIGLIFGVIGLGAEPVFHLGYLQIWAVMKDDVVPAIPLFIFMGYMAEQAGLMNRLFKAVRDLFAPMRGSLYLAVILTATLFAMATGIVGAAVSVLGIMAGSMMVKSGYDAKLSAGAIAAGGTLGILIPPSIMLIVMGPVLGVPVNQLYSAAFGPGFILAALYIGYCLVRSFMNPKLGPAVPQEERVGDVRILVRELLVGIVPLSGLISMTLGLILAGLATATEAASCGAFGATVLAACYGKLSFERVKSAAASTLMTSAMVLFLVVAAKVFGAVFTQLGASDLIAAAVAGVQLPDMAKLMLIMLLVFVLGWPFEWPTIILVFVPIFVPIVEAMDIGLSKPELMLWFGAALAVNLQTAFLSPPMAMSAFYLKQVMPDWNLKLIFSGMAQFIAIQFAFLVAMMLFPTIALWLPRSLS